MWLLSTDRAELHYFYGPRAVPGGYAILSHVWDPREVTFHDFQKVREIRAKSPAAISRQFASSKIEQSCILAERHGYKWIWIDTCCIDKRSSAELSEEINRMFEYYSCAEVCYAYLKDVPSDDDLQSANSAFRRSRWHTRGWTLQELIAPPFLVFLSADWSVLATRGDLAPLVEEVTRVSAAVLRFEIPLDEVSVARRMSWAATRQTTRIEDEAYCLMGIFRINIVAMYGEGRLAFRRLQEELMKQTMDTSLFAWGTSTTAHELQPTMTSLDIECAHADALSFLFAPAPSAFKDHSDISYDPPLTAEPQTPPSEETATPETTIMKLAFPIIILIKLALSVTTLLKPAPTLPESTFGNVPTFNIEPGYGVHAHVPVFEISGLLIVVLFCTKTSTQEAIGLVLTPCHTHSDPFRPLYHTGGHLRSQNNEPSRSFRLCVLHGSTFSALKSSWKDVYITHLPPPQPDVAPAVVRQIVSSLSAPFRLMRGDIDRLQDHGFGLDPRHSKSWDYPNPHSTTVLVFKKHVLSTGWDMYLEILLGQCEPAGATHWASVQFHAAEPSYAPRSFAHSCPEDHASEWPHGTRTFHDPACRAEEGWCGPITLSLTPCPVNPDRTRVVKVTLAG
ncbi:HET-domain-containing protein [Ganoderma leucocontextum]|nr:HET-domain-containing protein [Ganoderma leucocontextum]